MRFVKNIFAASILLTALCSFWSCNKDENHLSEAVLASANTVNFEATGSAEKMITVYADADWVAEFPEWVTLTPDRGTGTMDVVISVTDNLRGGTPDNPRKIAVVFKGRTLASRAEVLIVQNGDKYRDVKEYTVGEIAALKDEMVVSVPNVFVMAVTTEGFVVTDEQKSANLYVLNKTEVSVGDEISIKGTKFTDPQAFAYVDSDDLTPVSSGTVTTYPEPKDITDQVDTYTCSSREFISVSGILSGKNISIEKENTKFSVNITDAPAALGVAALNGHRVTVTGYFAGLAKPVLQIMATKIEDKGVVKTIFFSDDFSWLASWVTETGAGKPVEKGQEGQNGAAIALESAPNIYTHAKLGTPFLADVTGHGYELLNSATPPSIYIQNCYFKFGKGGVQSGIVFPPITNIPANTPVILAFDWAPFVGGSDKFDQVNLSVTITNGEEVTTMDPIKHTFVDGTDRLKWLHVELPINDVAITKDTKITIKPEIWGDTNSKTFQRWFLDNLEIYQAED